MKNSQHPTMQAIVKSKRGASLKTVPVPAPKKGEVLIKVAIAGYCRTDAFVAQGKIKSKISLILGHEFAGVVERIGKEVIGIKKGDRVAVMPISLDKTGHYSGSMLGVNKHGAFAQYAIAHQSSVYKIPQALGFKEAAYLEPIAASLSVLRAPIKNKEKGLILDSGRIAVLTHRVLRCFGFKSIKIVNSRDLNKLKDNSFNFAIETYPTTENLSHLIRIVRPGGAIILKSRIYKPVSISIGEIVKKDLSLYGTYYGDFTKGIELLISGKLKVQDIFGPVLNLKKAVRVLKDDIRKYTNKKIFFKP